MRTQEKGGGASQLSGAATVPASGYSPRTVAWPDRRQEAGTAAVSSNRPARRRGRPLPPGNTLFTPDASPGRQAVEQRSAAPLLFLRQLPAWIVPVSLAVAVFGGLTVRGPVGAVLLGLGAAFLAWLAAVSWPRLTPRGRLGRVAIIAVVLAVAVVQAFR